MIKIKLTKKNAPKVIQIINAFFKQSTTEYTGKKLREIAKGYWNKTTGNYIMPKYEELDCYIPQLEVDCHWHPLLKDKLFTDPPLLAVSSKYATSCIPIHEGDIIIYKGSQLIIKRLADARKLKLSISINTFIHKDYADNEKKRLIENYLDDFIMDNIQTDEYFENECRNEYSERTDLSNVIKNKLVNCLFENNFINCQKIFEYKDFTINLKRNVEYFTEHGFSEKNESNEIYNIEVLKDSVVIKNSMSYVDIVDFIYNETCQNNVNKDDYYNDNYDYLDDWDDCCEE